MGNWGYNHYKWSYIILLITGRDPSCKDYQTAHDGNPFRPPTNIWIWPYFFSCSSPETIPASYICLCRNDHGCYLFGPCHSVHVRVCPRLVRLVRVSTRTIASLVIYTFHCLLGGVWHLDICFLD